MIRIIHFIKKLITVSYLASQSYNTNFFKMLKRAYSLRCDFGFGPFYSFKFGLLDPKLNKKDLSKYCSNDKLQKIQRYYNPTALGSMTENKAIFYKFCIGSNIPTPKVFALFFESHPGWSQAGDILNNKKDWKDFFDHKVPEEFVIKPLQGSHGKDIYFFNKTGGVLRDENGITCDPNMIFELMNSNQNFSSFMIQQRLKNHSGIIKLSQSNTLHTIRFLTFVDSKNVAKILYSQLKIVSGDNKIDNFEYGETGNLLAYVSKDGYLKKVMTFHKNQPGPVLLDKHPKTGIEFANYKLPLWEETCATIKEISMKFLPLRFIGWDVAITPEGPFVVEGNFYFDPSNSFGDMGNILSQMDIPEFLK